MKNQNKILKITEIFLITIMWLVLFATPILFRENNNNHDLENISNMLITTIPLVILFLLNRFILVPKFLFSGKQVKYIVSAMGIIAALTVILYVYQKNGFEQLYPIRQELNSQKLPSNNPFTFGNNQKRNPGLPQSQSRPQPIPPYANFLILSILVVGFDTGLKTALRWTKVEHEKILLEKENVATQLVLLRNQVSPHFLMNTLNNIHSLIDINTEEAKEAIITLSKMIRHLLYESQSEQTTLKQEMEFLESYINLMKLRYNKRVKITSNFPTSIPNKTLPPFLFTSLIENAFKHGINYKDESFISIVMAIDDDYLQLVVKNSKSDKTSNQEYSGIGIENTRKQLTLLYGNRYNLDIIDKDNIFTVNLSIPL